MGMCPHGVARGADPDPTGDPQPGGDGRWHIPAGTAELSGGRKKKTKPCFVFKLIAHRFCFRFEHSKGQQVPREGLVRGAEGARALPLPR